MIKIIVMIEKERGTDIAPFNFSYKMICSC